MEWRWQNLYHLATGGHHKRGMGKDQESPAWGKIKRLQGPLLAILTGPCTFTI